MNKFFLTLTFLISAQISYADFRPLAHFYKLVPLEKAHVFSGVASKKELAPDSIKAFIWNIKKATVAGWDQEFVNYGKGQDLFLVQEAMENQRFEDTIHTMTGVRWDIGLSFLYTIYDDAGTGSMVGSVVDPSLVKVLHTKDMEPIVETPKSTTIAKYPLEGMDQELLVISVHGINLTDFGSFKRQMKDLRKEIEAHDGPVLFAGDFNTRTRARTQYLLSMAEELKFTNVTFKNGEKRMKFKFTPYYLDYSFVRGLKVKNAEVLVDSHGSDHKPMQLELQVAP
jgi:endonuclease/exonuclease/phosphatase (EEP) superfamily protein YafD